MTTTLGILDRVTDQSTLADVGVLCGRYGVYKFDVAITPTDRDAVIVVLRSVNHITIGKGATLTEAFDDAFARIMHRIGADASET